MCIDISVSMTTRLWLTTDMTPHSLPFWTTWISSWRLWPTQMATTTATKLWVHCVRVNAHGYLPNHWICWPFLFHRTVCGVRPGSQTLALLVMELTSTGTGMLVLEVSYVFYRLLEWCSTHCLKLHKLSTIQVALRQPFPKPGPGEPKGCTFSFLT